MIKHMGSPGRSASEAKCKPFMAEREQNARIQLITSTFLAMSTGAMVAIIIGAALPIFIVIVFTIPKNKTHS